MNQEKEKIRFGISSWSYPWSVGVVKGPQPEKPMTAVELLQKAEDYEVGLVQFADNLPLEKLSQVELDEVEVFARAKNIDIEVGTKGIEEEHLLRMLEIAQQLSSPILRILPAFFGSSAVMQDVEDVIRKILPAFVEAGVTLVLENTEAFKADEYVALLERVNHPRFRMCLDLGNALGCMEGPEFVMDKLLPWVGNFHFKDVNVKRSETAVGFTIYGTPAGQGDFSLPWILEKLEAASLTPSVILEHWSNYTGDMEETIALEDDWVRQSVAYLKSVIG